MNRWVVLVFAPILIVTGVLGFVLPGEGGAMSQTAPYNVFHIVAGSVGFALALRGPRAAARGFNVVFGLIDLYQLFASWAGLFPQRYFQWRHGDDVVHAVLGVALTLLGLFGG